MAELRNSPDRRAAELDLLGSGRPGERRDIRVVPRARNGGVARHARARVNARQLEQGARVAAGLRQDDHIRVRSGEQQRCLLLATAERLMNRGRRGSLAAAAGREPR